MKPLRVSTRGNGVMAAGRGPENL